MNIFSPKMRQFIFAPRPQIRAFAPKTLIFAPGANSRQNRNTGLKFCIIEVQAVFLSKKVIQLLDATGQLYKAEISFKQNKVPLSTYLTIRYSSNQLQIKMFVEIYEGRKTKLTVSLMMQRICLFQIYQFSKTSRKY